MVVWRVLAAAGVLTVFSNGCVGASTRAQYDDLARGIAADPPLRAPVNAPEPSGDEENALARETSLPALLTNTRRAAGTLDARARAGLEEARMRLDALRGRELDGRSVRKGEPVKLVVTRMTDKTCAKEIVIKDQGLREALPMGKALTLSFTPQKSGEIRYACGMDMISGVLVVE
jgi:hypothetical protein